MKSTEHSDIIGNCGFTPWIFFVGVTNDVPTVQNIKSAYKILAFIANWAKEHQDQDVRDALMKN